MILELVSTAVRVATLAVAPLIILYAFVVSTSGKAMNARGKRFIAACGLLGIGQILTALGEGYGNQWYLLFGNLAFLAGMIVLFVILEIRSRGHLPHERD